MELHGQAQNDFKKWLYKVYFKEYFNYQMIWQLMGETARLAVYVEWFDLQEIYGTFMAYHHTSAIYEYTIQEVNTLNGMNYIGFDSRSEAVIKFIEKANEIYNQKQQ